MYNEKKNALSVVNLPMAETGRAQISSSKIVTRISKMV